MAETPYPDGDSLALDGTTDSGIGFTYPTANETYTTTGLRRLWHLLTLLKSAPNALRVLKDGTNTFGVYAGQFLNGDTLIDYSQADAQSLTNDATNYIYLTADGTLTKNTTGFPSPSTTPHIPLATIAVGSASQAQVDDEYEHVDLVDYRRRAVYSILGGSSARITVRNDSGVGMDAADLVYISGYNATDDCPEVELADADDPTKRATHVLLAGIGDGSTGDVAEYAVIVDNTTGRAVGDLLYLSATAGDWTQTAPTGADQIKQVVGVVRTVGASGTVVFMPGLAIVQAAGTSFLQDQAVTQDKLNDAQVEKMAIVHVEDLGVGADIADRPIFVHPRAVTLVSVGILTEDAPAGVDDANTAVIEIDDDASNNIVTKTYDTDPQPPDSDYEDLGALNGTHKVLTAAEHLLLSVTQGATADLPAFSLLIRYLVGDA